MDQRTGGYDSKHLILRGVVQGVGFRPYVASEGKRYRIRGTVKNIGGAVEVTAAGKPQNMRLFLHSITHPDLPHACVESVEELPETGQEAARKRQESEVRSKADGEAYMEKEPDNAEQADRLEDWSAGVRRLKADTSKPMETEAKQRSDGQAVAKQEEQGSADFRIIESSAVSTGDLFLLPDIGICPKCFEEIFDPHDRRFYYPFNSCVSCGPRYSILKDLPYDRRTTTMEPFAMCAPCAKEYQETGNRRRHAQTIGCPDCGPKLYFEPYPPQCSDATSGQITQYTDIKQDKRLQSVEETRNGKKPDHFILNETVASVRGSVPKLPSAEMDTDMTMEKYVGRDALDISIRLLCAGRVLAIKGIGGYHLACRARDVSAVRAIRKMKGREEKPLAVLFPDLAAIQECCFVSGQEEELLCGTVKPIVLLDVKGTSPFAPEVAGESNRLGCMLPYTALHALISARTGPLVLTSANRSSLPLIHDDDEMRAFAAKCEEPLFAGICLHDREILRQMDDSVVQIAAGRPQIMRLGRGYAPRAIRMPLPDTDMAVETGDREECMNRGQTGLLRHKKIQPVPQGTVGETKVSGNQEILASGGDLKAAYCLVRGDRALVGHYFGDLASCEVQERYVAECKEDRRILKLHPDIVACDMHPGYFSSAWARTYKKKAVRVLTVQHHAAHIASVACEHGITKGAIGIAFDGTGYGTDGAIWGGEFFYWQGDGVCRRKGHLEYIKIVGADAAAKQAARSAACMLLGYGLDATRIDPASDILAAALAHDVNTAYTSSMGRLFDAVSALLGICKENSYEGRCPILLEQAAEAAALEGLTGLPLHFTFHEEDGMWIASPRKMLETLFRLRFSGSTTNYTDGETAGCADQRSAGCVDRKAAVPVDQEAVGQTCQDTAGCTDREMTGRAALGFHMAVAELVERFCVSHRNCSDTVLLSGGVFANRLLLTMCRQRLTGAGFAVYTNEQLPPGDGCISLGQAYMAALAVSRHEI